MRVVGLLIAGIPLAVAAVRTALAATGSSSVLAFALGAGSVPAVLIVALGFALCSGVGLAPVFPSRVTRAP